MVVWSRALKDRWVDAQGMGQVRVLVLDLGESFSTTELIRRVHM